MTFEEFERRAEEMFASIPAETRKGIEYVAAERKAMPHPELDEVYILGECIEDEADAGGEGPDAVPAGVHLYYGSFVKLAELDPEFDWEGELREALTHEIDDRREGGAGEDAEEELAYPVAENIRRREGLPFSPLFYRAGSTVAHDVWAVDGDYFYELRVDALDLENYEELEVLIGEETVMVRVPEEAGDVTYLSLEGFAGEALLETVVVLVRRHGLLKEIFSVFGALKRKVREYTLAPGDWRRVGDEGAGEEVEGDG
ncbi:MAG TPA: hypothetical protein VFQ45_05265 [Longimicrobium sp.]|nr:hypothetical protein [Longimicrobium sp.]